MNGSALKRGPSCARASPRSEWGLSPELSNLSGHTIVGHGTKDLAIEPVDVSPRGGCKPHRIFEERIENRLKVKSRAADELEDFAGRGLLLEGNPQLTIASLQLGEEPHVLDRYDCLVGEGLQKSDLVVCEPSSFTPRYGDRSERLVLAKQRYRR